jgi:DnaJ-class molecular chaperone
MSASTSHYDTLKVPRDAPLAVLRAAYRRAAQQHHPDRNAGAANAHDAMARINEAYAVLSHPQRRASYDKWLQAIDARRRAQAAAQAAQPSLMARTRPWGIVAATLAFTALSIGTVLYKSATTSPAPAPLHGSQVVVAR